MAAQQWQAQYIYDKADSTMRLADLQFASATRGVAVGMIETRSGRRFVEGRKYVAVVTADGGAHWDLVPVKDPPISLFFLNEQRGWMVTTKGIWVTTEAGKSWRKLEKSPKDIERVCFLDENHGYAVGSNQGVFVTHDAGKSWEPLPEAKKLPGNRQYSRFNWISFATPQLGIITGRNVPPDPRAPKFPGWMDPESAVAHRELPHLSLALQTQDGGKTWKSSSSSIFGAISRVRFTGPTTGISLIEYSEAFMFPSEVFRLRWPEGGSESIFRDKDCGITDVWLMPDGKAYLAGVRFRGRLRAAGPGKVEVLESNGGTWRYMDVDYRAVASRAYLAGAEGHLWLATDEGMILRLVDAPAEPAK